MCLLVHLLAKSLNDPSLVNAFKGRETCTLLQTRLVRVRTLQAWEGKGLVQVEAVQSICNPRDELSSSENPGGGSDTTFPYECQSKALGTPH